MRIMKSELSRIKLFIGNVWMILRVDPLHKVIFSFSCAVFSLFAAGLMRSSFSRVLVDLEGVRYIDKTNMIAVCASPVTVLLILLFLIIMTYTALFEPDGSAVLTTKDGKQLLLDEGFFEDVRVFGRTIPCIAPGGEELIRDLL